MCAVPSRVYQQRIGRWYRWYLPIRFLAILVTEIADEFDVQSTQEVHVGYGILRTDENRVVNLETLRERASPQNAT